MNQYQKTTEKKKQAIIQSALSLFKEKGFKETSIQSIAKVAEVSPVSIYNYFDKKDNLVALCINELFKDIIQEAENILLSNIDYKSNNNADGYLLFETEDSKFVAKGYKFTDNHKKIKLLSGYKYIDYKNLELSEKR